MLKAPLRRRAVDPEVDDALPMLSVSSRRDWATEGTAECTTEGAAESVPERDQGLTSCWLAAPRLDGPVLGDNANDCWALLSPEAAFEDMASAVVQGLVVARMITGQLAGRTHTSVRVITRTERYG